MNVRSVALVFGIVFIAVGLLGFVPGAVEGPPADAPELTMEGGYGYLLGLFPVNLLHNLVHLLFGVWGIFAYPMLSRARLYLRSVAVIYGVLVVFGLVPLLKTTFGLIPVFGHDVWLHALLALVAAVFGWKSEPVSAPPPLDA